MRVLVLDCKNTNEYSCYTVYKVVYDDRVNGPIFFINDEELFIIPDIPMDEVNEICKSLVINGYVDVTKYGEIYVYYT